MTRSKEEKAQFITHLRAAAKELGESNPVIPSNLERSYSLQNCLMILFQKPSATNVAGFHDWKKAGRAVKKGARGAAILVPLGTRVDDDGMEKPFFSWRYVFDISDTEELTSESPKLARELVSA
jgi:N-terminal domain of anti-restriction factor ArdC